MANNNASDIVEAALNEALKLMEDHDDGDILVEWMAICFVTNPGKEKGEGYPVLYSNGRMPTHHAKGLLDQAKMVVSVGYFADQIEDEEDED